MIVNDVLSTRFPAGAPTRGVARNSYPAHRDSRDLIVRDPRPRVVHRKTREKRVFLLRNIPKLHRRANMGCG